MAKVFKLYQQSNEAINSYGVFQQIDELRAVFKESIKEIKLTRAKKLNSPYTPTSTYRASNFYIGRNLTRLSFYDCAVGFFYLTKVKYRMASLYPQFKYHIDGVNVHVYLRGDRRN
jgi:hypothetical protein